MLTLELNGILFTMVNMTARLTQDVMTEVRNHFGDRVYESIIPRNVRVSEAPSMGTPVVFLDPRSKGAEAYKAFAWEFMAKNPTRFDLSQAVAAVKNILPSKSKNLSADESEKEPGGDEPQNATSAQEQADDSISDNPAPQQPGDAPANA